VDDVQEMYRDIADTAPSSGQPVGPATVRRVHATLMSALGSAVRRGVLERNPAAFVELPRAPYPRMRVWTAAQLAEFLDSVGQDRLHPLFLLLALTGMRRGEDETLAQPGVGDPDGVRAVALGDREEFRGACDPRCWMGS